jgi:hypothetical protein
METETYELDAFCNNCNFEGKIRIPKGMILTDMHCPTCKTKMLEKKLPAMRMIPHIEDYR